MKHALCTLFDKNYLTRGLAMYTSLRRFEDNFVLWVLAMDDDTYKILNSMNLEHMRVLKLSDVEDDALKTAKQNRSMVEYCWTLSSSLPLHVLKQNPDLETVAYLDSDLYFFSGITPIYDELGDDNILIIRHNYSEQLKYLEKRSGIYNVSLVIFKNNEVGKKCLERWREQCLEWCYAHYEDGKLGDQMYLDDWTDTFEGVHILKHKGANVAPWNINRYTLTKKNDTIYVDEDPLIFYHYHSLKLYRDGTHQLCYSSYTLHKEDEELVYPVYIEALADALKTVRNSFPEYSGGYADKPGLQVRIKNYIKKILTRYFVVR